MLIILVAIIGIYGVIYVAITNVLMPSDLDTFKSELSTVQVPVNNDSSIKEMENAAAYTESASSLEYVSPSERSAVASSMRISNTPPPEFFNQNLEVSDQFFSYRMWAYTLIFRGDISNELKNISSTHEEISRLNNETESLNQKLYTDMEKGDSKAYAEDLKLIANNLKQYNTAMAELKNHLKTLVNLLE